MLHILILQNIAIVLYFTGDEGCGFCVLILLSYGTVILIRKYHVHTRISLCMLNVPNYFIFHYCKLHKVRIAMLSQCLFKREPP